MSLFDRVRAAYQQQPTRDGTVFSRFLERATDTRQSAGVTTGIAGGTASIPSPSGGGDNFFTGFGASLGQNLGGVLANVANHQLTDVNERYGGGRPVPGLSPAGPVGALGLALLAMLAVVLLVKLVR